MLIDCLYVHSGSKFSDTAISRQVIGAHLKGGVDGNDPSSNLNAIKL